MLDTSVNGTTHLDNVGIACGGYQDANGALAIAEELVAGGCFIPLFDMSNVAQAQLVIVVALDEHLAYIGNGLELVSYVEADALVAVIKVAAIGGFVLAVQGGEHFGRFHAQCGHAVLQQGDVDALRAVAVEVHAFYILHIAHLALD